MCGIIGANINEACGEQLITGLGHLAYRGYDSAGMAIIDETGQLTCLKQAGKINALMLAFDKQPLPGGLGIAHTRWATHGSPNQKNAHPHLSHHQIAVVHNGIIENYKILRERLQKDGYTFLSDTDSEAVAHLLHLHSLKQKDFNQAIRHCCQELEGSYALAILNSAQPDTLWGVRQGSPLLAGLATRGYYLASDTQALAPLAQKAINLEDGDLIEIGKDALKIFNKQQEAIERPSFALTYHDNLASKGPYQHYMQKEIAEQPAALTRTLTQTNASDMADGSEITQTASVSVIAKEKLFNQSDLQRLKKIKRIQIVACGTSYHAGLVAAQWLQQIARIPTQVTVASEQRYQDPIVEADTLFVALSQSGETADTLAALTVAKKQGYSATLGICNTPYSSLAKETDMLMLIQAGPEIGVAATKTFTCQLATLLLLTITLAELHPDHAEQAQTIKNELKKLPQLAQKCLLLDARISQVAKTFKDKQHALFLGRGIHFPVALEGALKLKEISYIHAEAYPSGELKHGPLALIDDKMPVIVVAPQDHLWKKLASNIEEVHARGAQVYLFADSELNTTNNKNTTILEIPHCSAILSPFAQSIALQLLAYHAAIIKGTDIDQPRNLAKSVTVE